eukprot:4402225-Ditylum_brightwellii.AAC.1
MADLNSTLGDTQIGMFLGERGLHDLVRQKYGITQINSHINGSKQRDFMLGTAKVVKAFEQGGILQFHNVVVADHR